MTVFPEIPDLFMMSTYAKLVFRRAWFSGGVCNTAFGNENDILMTQLVQNEFLLCHDKRCDATLSSWSPSDSNTIIHREIVKPS